MIRMPSKRKNSAKRGNEYEKEVMKILQREGWITEKAPKKIVWIPDKSRPFKRIPITLSHDLFGCWDIIAKKAGEKTLWIQVGTIEMVSDKIKQVRHFPDSAHDICAVYARVRRERIPHFRIYYAHNLYEWKGDTALVIRDEKPSKEQQQEQEEEPVNA